MTHSLASGQPHRLLHAPRAVVRQRLASTFVADRPPAAPVLVVAPSLEAGSRVLRLAAEGRPAAFGHQRATMAELAARLAAAPLAASGRAQVAPVVLDAVCARMVHRLREPGAPPGSGLGRYEPVGDRPGFSRALAQTFAELGLARVAPDAPELPADLARLYGAYRRELATAGLADRAAVFEAALERVADPRPHPLLDAPMVLFDVAIWTALEEAFIERLARRSPVAAIVPSGDGTTLRRLERALGVRPEADGARLEPDERSSAGSSNAPTTALTRLGRQLFGEVVERGPIDETVELFSAPGESRECVEIARRILRSAEQGVSFDRMAVLTHAPERYRAHLVEAFRRAGVPAHFSRGTKRPDPAGRALLALLECRAERLSARGFAEYLSLGMVSDVGEDGAPPPAEGAVPWAAPDDEMVGASAKTDDGQVASEATNPTASDPGAAENPPVVAGTLRAPWRWERLIGDAAVIGGAARWRRRLEGLERSLAHKLAGLDDPDDPRRRSLERSQRDLGHLRAFALPLLEELEALPEQATWGDWLRHLSRLTERAVRQPERVHGVLRELSPMAPVGPVGLTEVQLVLERRLTEMTERPSTAPAGRVYVASPEEARGLTFDRVFVPGLTERMFPRKVIEDPVALDSVRARVSGELATTETRVERERLALRIAIGAAERHLIVSYPRLDTERGRPRVPSFYGLEVLRAIEGELPTFEQLAARAEEAGGARMAWPAPDEPEAAIDPAEYDLAVLRRVLEAPDLRSVDGSVHYLVKANDHLGRALRSRALKWQEKWSKADGLVNPSEEARELLEGHRLECRAYSATALEQLAACPYRFYLRAIVGLAPREAPEAMEALDPLARGNLIHAIQSACLARLRAEGRLPLTEEGLERARLLLDETVREIAARFAEELAPAIDRVWQDAVADVQADLTEWLLHMSERPDWVPRAFELAFGLEPREGHDRASVPDPVRLPEGLTLRGAIDLVEERGNTLRATDHKTGAAPGRVGTIAGGRVLQPVLYARVLEVLFPEREVVGGRLYYCTARGRFEEHSIPLNAEARESVGVLVEAAGQMLERGFLPAAPADGECARCDYRSVCGPVEERRVRHKPVRPLRLLQKLRKRP